MCKSSRTEVILILKKSLSIKQCKCIYMKLNIHIIFKPHLLYNLIFFNPETRKSLITNILEDKICATIIISFIILNKSLSSD